MPKNKDEDRPRCTDCGGNGGEWKVEPSVPVQGNGQRKPGKQMWVICKKCGGSGKT